MTDQEYLDRCAIEAMNGLISHGYHADHVVSSSYYFAEAMLAERKKRMEGKNEDPLPQDEECGYCLCHKNRVRWAENPCVIHKK